MPADPQRLSQILTFKLDVIGRRPIVLAGIFGIGLATVFMGLSSTLGGVLFARSLGKQITSSPAVTSRLLRLSRWSLLRQHRGHSLCLGRDHRFDKSSDRFPALWLMLAVRCHYWVRTH